MKTILAIILMSLFFTIACDDPNTASVPKPKYTNGQELVFGSTIIGEYSDSEMIELTNTGTGDLEVDSAQLLSNTGEYDISNLIDQLPANIASGSSLSFRIRFTPAYIRTSHKNKLKLSGSVVLDDYELTINAPENAPEIKLSPKSLMFSNGNIQSFEITNVGNAVLTITEEVIISNDNFTFDSNLVIEKDTRICPRNASEDNENCTGIVKNIIATVKYDGLAGSTDEGNVIIYNDGELNKDVSFVYLTAATNVCHLYVTNLENDALDFGSVFISSTASKNIALINTGGADCILDSLEVISNNDIFVPTYLEAYPEITAPITIPSRSNATTENPNQYIFKVAFTPLIETNYTATLKMTGSDPLWVDGKVEIPLLGTGTQATLPVAECDIEVAGVSVGNYAEVEPAIDGGTNPPSIITLNGSNSFDPNGETLTYKWEKVSAPVGSVAVPRSPTSARSNYFVDLSGEHQLKLTVTNQSGLTASCEVTANGITSNALHIELFWDKNGDLDLHLKKFGTTDSAWGTTNDCFWNNSCARGGLEWGSPGEINNPTLDRDDITAKGPENINIDTPEMTPSDESYMVGVKNFSHTGTPTATVRIYCNGGAQFEYSMSLPHPTSSLDSQRSFWWVANIEWTANGCNIAPMGSVGNYPGASGTR